LAQLHLFLISAPDGGEFMTRLLYPWERTTIPVAKEVGSVPKLVCTVSGEEKNLLEKTIIK
jgi:hypothetical protein